MESKRIMRVLSVPAALIATAAVFFAVYIFLVWKFFSDVSLKEFLSTKFFFDILNYGWTVAESISPGALPFWIVLVSLFIIIILAAALMHLAVGFTERVRVVVGEVTEDLYRSRERFRELYENGPVPYLLLSLDGTIWGPNRAALRLFEGTKEELEGTPFVEFYHEEDRGDALQYVEFFKSQLPVVNKEIRIVRKNGEVRWVILSIFVLRTEHPHDYEGLVSLIDITERKEVERTKTEFVSLAAHQLRTPLALMKWHTEALLGGTSSEQPETRKRYLRRIYRNNERLIETVTVLLNISRLEMGTLAPINAPVDIREIVGGILEEFAYQAKGKNVSLEASYDENIGEINTDEKLLRVVIQNLVSNAVKYTPPDGSVRVRAIAEGGSVRISVADTGYGIPPEDQEKIFTKMFRAGNAKAVDADGIGLGLYMTQSIVEVLGGTIKFSSEFKKGTTFLVTISGQGGSASECVAARTSSRV